MGNAMTTRIDSLPTSDLELLALRIAESLVRQPTSTIESINESIEVCIGETNASKLDQYFKQRADFEHQMALDDEGLLMSFLT